MVPDSDMVPIPGMAQSLATFLARPEQRECQMCAYVVPVYEIKSTIGQYIVTTFLWSDVHTETKTYENLVHKFIDRWQYFKM